MADSKGKESVDSGEQGFIVLRKILNVNPAKGSPPFLRS